MELARTQNRTCVGYHQKLFQVTILRLLDLYTKFDWDLGTLSSEYIFEFAG